MPSSSARKMMIECQLRTNKVEQEDLLSAMMAVPREVFLPDSKKAQAYLDAPVDLGSGRALMEPMVFARMAQALDLASSDRVLVVACGTGYGAAVLARIASQVVALDCLQPMASAASAHLQKLGVENVSVVLSYLAGGFEKSAPYQAILIEGAVDFVPDVLFGQLAEGGKLVAVEATAQAGGSSTLGRVCVWQKQASGVAKTVLFEANVPTLPEFAGKPEFAL